MFSGVYKPVTRSVEQTLWLLAVLSNVIVDTSQATELYTSLHHVEELFNFDNMVGTIASMLPAPEQATKRYLDLYARLLVDAAKIPGEIAFDEVSKNPLHVYTLFKRLILYFPILKEEFQIIASQEDENSTIRQKIYELLFYKQSIIFPKKRDFLGAADAIARLYHVYDLPLARLTRGEFKGIYSSVRLSPYDCLHIGNSAKKQGMLSIAWDWYSEALRLSQNIEMSLFIKEIQDDLIQLHDSTFEVNDLRFFPSKLEYNRVQKPWDTVFFRLCRGDQVMDPSTASTLKCYISPRGSPYLLLQPVKLEDILRSPQIYMIYDVINDKEIEEIKTMAKAQLARSKVFDNSENTSEDRVSKTSWLSEIKYKLVKKLSKRISDITGLVTHEGYGYELAGEMLQVVSYGIGGHYKNHMDTFYKNAPAEKWDQMTLPENVTITGDRLATFMFYLSDVKEGGRTAFPNAMVSATPVKGAAVFWFNIFKNGTGDNMTEHGGCPVLYGHKWIANKWIREGKNFQTRPCALDPNA